MAKCDEGYLCQVCGQAVKRLDESALYLQYVVGWISSDEIHTRPECHLRCQPTLAQFIVHKSFAAVELSKDFELSKERLDSDFARQREKLVTAGYERLRQLQRNRSEIPIEQYPLSAVSPNT